MQVNANIAPKRFKTIAPTATHDLASTPVPSPTNQGDLARYFAHAKPGNDHDAALQEISFGEFLVEQEILDRYQLFRALQMQDRQPGVRLGECAAALGYAPISAIERLYERFAEISTVDV